MKFLGDMLYAIAVLAFVASAVGDEEGGASPDPSPRVCPVAAADEEGNQPMVTKVIGEAIKECFMRGTTNETIELLRKEETNIEDYRAFFHDFCQKQGIVKECLDEVDLKLDVCENKIYVKGFKIVNDLLQSLVFETGCQEEGENLALLSLGIMRIVENKLDMEKVNLCGFRIKEMMQKIVLSNADISSKVFFMYRQIATYDKCFTSKDIDADFKLIYSSYMEKILKTMKCIHPQDGTLVLCETMDASLLTTPSVCEILFPEVQEQPLYEILRDRAEKCFKHIDQVLKSEATGDMEAFSEYFKKYCTKSTDTWYCVRATIVHSEACLNETQFKEYALLFKLAKPALAHLCADEGVHFATIAHGVYHLKGNSPDEPNAVSECLAVAKAAKKQHDSNAFLSKNLSSYRGLEAFKDCFLNKLEGDKASFDDATTFMNEMLRKMQCVHPEDGTKVFCETIVNN